MTLNFYTLGVIYLVYSFLGWVAETVVATIRGGRFANRGAAAGPFCFIYGTTGVLLAVSFGDLRAEPVYLFFACMMAATVMEWITAKLLERLHRRKWWDYSGKKFNLNGYVCLQYSLLWGALGTASVLWGNNVLLQLCAHIPVWLLRPAVWVSLTVAVLDQIGSAVLVQQYAARHPVLEQLNQTPAVTRQNTVSTMSPRNAPITNSHSRSDTLRKFFSPFRSAVCSCRAAAG